MEGIKKYILQQELLNRLNKNQIDFFNTLYDIVQMILACDGLILTFL